MEERGAEVHAAPAHPRVATSRRSVASRRVATCSRHVASLRVRAPHSPLAALSHVYSSLCRVRGVLHMFDGAEITLLKIFYIFTFYLSECITIFYRRANPTTTLSLFFIKCNVLFHR
ncbi:hypothetical protein O3G_MSEX007138 [Manduca sexta]|uniref:Uncharacterized protein n=1 Tax=Manduca sexta TaxID=7130 RepID=A0A921Z4V2_MANSE|nr:hypothetical protein O3G_MSEX007138 [Manduca sexta]